MSPACQRTDRTTTDTVKRTMQLWGAQRPLVEVRRFESLALLGEGGILAMVGAHRVTMRMVVVVVVVPSAHCTYCGGGGPTASSHTSHPVTMVEPTVSAMLVSTHGIAIQHMSGYGLPTQSNQVPL